MGLIKKKRGVYLDSAANTFLDKQVLKDMKYYLSDRFMGNSFGIHKRGTEACIAVENARSTIADILGFHSDEIFFTSGATEGNNWVIKSLALNELKKQPEDRRMHILCSKLEHSSVLNTCKDLISLGFEVEFFECEISGITIARNLIRKIREDTLLVCVMAVNNETGVINQIDKISRYVHRKNRKTLFLSDFTQFIPCGGEKISKLREKYAYIDYFTFSGHKIYGPTGIGCLIVRRQSPLYPLLIGGSQENGRRGGTHNVAGIVGLASAVKNILPHEIHYYKLYKYLIDNIHIINSKYNINIKENITNKERVYNIINLNCYDVVKGSSMADELNMHNIECSAGAACDANIDGGPIPSHVLLALGISKNEATSSIRISFNKHTTKKDIKKLIIAIEEIIKEQLKR